MIKDQILGAVEMVAYLIGVKPEWCLRWEVSKTINGFDVNAYYDTGESESDIIIDNDFFILIPSDGYDKIHKYVKDIIEKVDGMHS